MLLFSGVGDTLVSPGGDRTITPQYQADSSIAPAPGRISTQTHCTADRKGPGLSWKQSAFPKEKLQFSWCKDANRRNRAHNIEKVEIALFFCLSLLTVRSCTPFTQAIREALCAGLAESKSFRDPGSGNFSCLCPSLGGAGVGYLLLSHTSAWNRFRRGSWQMGMTVLSWWCCSVGRMTTNCRTQQLELWPC